jgi:hypothetical protein
MGMTLDTIVPWGRSYEEYAAMFGLTETNLTQRILGCGDGPAGFNSTLTKRGGSVVSVDPVYAFNATQIRGRIADTYDTVMAQMREHFNDYMWTVISSVEELGRIRMLAMEEFLHDYVDGKHGGRYIAGALPSLPFGEGTFDIALSSHFLFLYSTHLSDVFHLQALREMLRVAREVRIFPLLTLDGIPSPHLKTVAESFSRQGYSVEVTHTSYEFQRGGNQMLTIQPV